MRIPKRVNAFLDRVERHTVPLLVSTALVIAAVAALWLPLLAGVFLGLAAGGFTVHVRLSRRLVRARREVDDLLRENGALRHRNTVLSSGVITRDAQMTQALVAIPELEPNEDPQRTQALPTLFEDRNAGDRSAGDTGSGAGAEQVVEVVEVDEADEAGSGDGGRSERDGDDLDATRGKGATRKGTDRKGAGRKGPDPSRTLQLEPVDITELRRKAS